MPARLYHERIAAGSQSAPARWLALTHGIYGAGSNWRSIARKLVERRPEWGVLLVDLRQHGRSEPGEPPHTIAACAEDLTAWAAEVAARPDGGPVAAIGGHSFGGKVVLATRGRIDVAQHWVLDSNPGARPGGEPSRDSTVVRVLELMERMPRSWQRREDFVTAVVADGHDVGLARWLAMNLVPAASGGVALRLDLVALREMLDDYYVSDLWDVLDAPGDDVEVVLADRATTLPPADQARLAAAPPHVHVHHVDAGHWLHVDAPEVLIDLFARLLP